MAGVVGNKQAIKATNRSRSEQRILIVLGLDMDNKEALHRETTQTTSQHNLQFFHH